jgi:hypothetical protein
MIERASSSGLARPSKMTKCLRLAVAVAIVATLGSGARAADAQAPYVWTDDPARPPMPGNVHGFVRDYSGKVAITDQQLTALTAANVGTGKRWAAIDFIFQQCYGGTFLNRLSTLTAVPFTAVAAADWNQVAWNVVGVKEFPALENFTSSWLLSATSKPNAGMREIAYRARERDWTGPVNKVDYNPQYPEYPMYISSDVTPGGASDLRQLQQAGSGRLFTAIGVFGLADKIAERHRTNAGRVVRLVRARSAPEQITSLLGDGTAGYPAGEKVMAPDSLVTPALAVGAANTAPGLTSALTGAAFGKSAEPGDRLLLYITGHGGRAVYERFRDGTIDSTPQDGVPDGVRIHVRLPVLEQRESGLPTGPSFNPNMFGDSDDPNPDRLQFHLRRAIGFDATDPTAPKLLIGGVDYTALLIPVAGDAVLELPTVNDHLNPPVAQVYQLELPHNSWFNVDTPEIELEFSQIGALALEPHLLSAFDVWAGDNEFLVVNVPEPTTGVLTVVGLTMLVLRRLARRPAFNDGSGARDVGADRFSTQ